MIKLVVIFMSECDDDENVSICDWQHHAVVMTDTHTPGEMVSAHSLLPPLQQ